ncbi:MAG TPA: hypothetical protein VMR79_03175 [Verrucomicrobiae bacterium]|nr:hypothetical protein [Verrucomicrobiae bacterium]
MLALGLSGVAAAEFVAREKDFRCLLDGQAVPGKHFFVFHRRHGKLRKALRIAELDLPDKRYPVGTILQLFPFEAMVKRGGGFNPEGDGWEFFRLSVTPAGTRILARGGAEVRNFAGSCQGCHAAGRSYDFVCEGHAVASLGLSEDAIRALQHDPRCPPTP